MGGYKVLSHTLSSWICSQSTSIFNSAWLDTITCAVVLLHTWAAVTRWGTVATGYSHASTHTWREERSPLTVTSSSGVAVMVYENKLLKCMETLETMEKEVAALNWGSVGFSSDCNENVGVGVKRDQPWFSSK